MQGVYMGVYMKVNMFCRVLNHKFKSSEANEIEFGTLSMCWRQNCAPWSLTTPPSLAHSLPLHLSGRPLLVIAAGTFSLAQLTSCNLKDGKRDTKTDSIRKRQIRDGCMTGQADYGQNETKTNWRGIRRMGRIFKNRKNNLDWRQTEAGGRCRGIKGWQERKRSKTCVQL